MSDAPLSAWSWHHTGTTVADVDVAVATHRELFGFEVVFEARGMTELIRSVTGLPGIRADLVQMRSPRAEQTLEFIAYHGLPDQVDPALPVRPGMAHTCFTVPDLDAALRAVLTRGGRLFGEVTTFAEGRGAYCRTSAGTALELLEDGQPTPLPGSEEA
ncbi:MAG: VOC family protein [Nitriliruptoraceae bacterium]|nr:VOC family protein [Nitriliruptoraceae bacterium]